MGHSSTNRIFAFPIVSMATFNVLLLVLCVMPAVADLNILIMGDWGGDTNPPYTTPGEVATAKQMQTTAAQIGASFVLALGDNFYYNGVKSVDDPRFQHTFENVFVGKNLQIPFYVLAGNHDHYGTVQAEIDYSGRSSRWKFPSLWYSFTKTTSAGTVQFVMIDTVVIAGNSGGASGLEELKGDELPGPADVKMAQDELSWLKTTLAASTADYLIVAGHYPVWSVCEHGPTSTLVKELRPLLQRYNVTAYLAGHDHCVAYIKDPSDAVDYHVMGAAHGCDTDFSHKNAVPSGSLKFHWSSGQGAFGVLSITSSGLVVKQLADDGSVLYTAPVRHSRKH